MRWPAVAAYVVMLAATAAIFFAIAHYGSTLTAPPPPAQPPKVARSALHDSSVLPSVVGALAAVIVLGRLLGVGLRHVRQPPVIGEVLAGIVLGPSLLGRVAPQLVLPETAAPLLGLIAQIGVVIYMFIVGLELNLDRAGRRAHTTVAISHASIVAPFLLGSLLALYLYPRFSTNDVPFTSFALFVGVAMSITAFPVLARILSDRGMTHSELGTIALTCAAVDDVTAWCLLAGVVAVVEARPDRVLLVVLLTIVFITVMLMLIRPLARRVAAAWDRRPAAGAVLTLAGVALSAFVAERIGVHAIFGAFLFGAILPHDGALARAWIDRLKTPVILLLLPAFFALAGMRTRIDLIADASGWLVCGLIIVVATVGKVGGTYTAARLTGLGARYGAALGVLMNTRGLMQLIVLNVGLDLGVLSPTLFTLMVLMALATTMATSPLLDRALQSADSASWAS
jgi:Kef-type K+ transport system membrane component KefB